MVDEHWKISKKHELFWKPMHQLSTINLLFAYAVMLVAFGHFVNFFNVIFLLLSTRKVLY